MSVCTGAGFGLAGFNDSEVQVLQVSASLIVGNEELRKLHLLFEDCGIFFVRVLVNPVFGPDFPVFAVVVDVTESVEMKMTSSAVNVDIRLERVGMTSSSVA